MKEFDINKYIKLKLEGEETHIYVNNELFRQCKYLLIHIPRERLSYTDNLNSIDDAEEIMDSTLEEAPISTFNITPDQEFWAHCSNLQAWAENNYNTRLLHRTIAFPLLKRLYEVGDPQAKIIFKEEIVKRYESGNKSVRKFLLNGRYIHKYALQELLEFFLDNRTLNILDSISQLIGRSYQIKLAIDFFDLFDSPQFSLVINSHGLIGLDLTVNGLESLPESLLQLESLRELYLGTNNLKTLSRNIERLKSLEKLSLSDNLLKSIPDSIKNLEALECLSLSLNQLEEIPDGVFHLRNLKYLNLGHNKISHIPDAICNLRSLEHLVLNYNNLEEVSEFLDKLEQLKSLSLGYNNLRSLPESLAGIRCLNRIDLDRKFKGKVPKSIRHLVKYY